MLTVKPVFNRRNKKLSEDDKAPIEICFYADGVKRYFHTRLFIVESEWSDKKWVVNRNAIKINGIINKKIRALEDYYYDHLNNKGYFDEQDIKAFSFDGNKESFTAFLEQEIRSDNSVAPGTKKYREVMLSKLRETAGEVSFNRLNFELIDKFNKYMVDQKLRPGTVRKYHNQLKKFITIAVKKNKVKENPYKYFKLQRQPTNIKTCLWTPELDAIWKLKYEDNIYDLVRLKFLFSCYTGLRISDNTALKWDNIRDGKIILEMQKTARQVIIPINLLGERAGLILEKAKRYDCDTVFKPISDQKVNEYLKLIAIDAQVPVNLIFHVSRHTFATLVAHKTGSVFDVMRYTGIAGMDVAAIYINLAKLFST